MALYNASGNFRVTVGDTTRTGIYAADGSLRVTIVSGSTYTGLFAADGSYNVVVVAATDTPISLYHSCGAFRGVAVSASASNYGAIAPNGALYMEGLFAAAAFAGSKTNVLSWCFDDTAGDMGSVVIRDTVTSANNFTSADTATILAKFTGWSATSPMMTRGPDGTLKHANHNLILQSQTLATTWTASQASVASDSIAAPDGTTTADTITEDSTAANSHRIFQNLTLNGTPVAFSVCLKAKERTWAYLRLEDSGGIGRHVWFNLATGSIGTTETGIDATISDLGSGWYRCTLARTSSYSGTNNPLIGITTGNNVQTHDGDGTSGIYAWGAQVYYTPVHSTEYIPTTTAARFNIPTTYDTSGNKLGFLDWEARTNAAWWSRDLTQSAHVKTNATAYLTAKGTDGIAGSASRLVATAANGNVIQQITATSAQRASSARVRRAKGSGTVKMSQGETTGSELVPNNSFDNASLWTASSGDVVVAAGVATWTSAASNTNLQTNPAIGPTAGKLYKGEIVIDSISGGTIRLGNEAGVALSPDYTTSGTKTFYFVAPSTSAFRWRCVNITTAVVSSVSLYECTETSLSLDAVSYAEVSGTELITSTSTPSGGWTESGGVITAPGTSGGTDRVLFALSSPVVAGKLYKVTIPNTMPANGFYVDFDTAGGGQIGNLSSADSVVYVVPSGSSSSIRIGRWVGTPTGTIGPISVKEVEPSQAWTEAETAAATITNPCVALWCATSGDAIDVDHVQCEVGAKASSPIITAGAAVTRAASLLTIDTSLFNWSGSAGTSVLHFTSAIPPGAASYNVLTLGSSNFCYVTNNATHIRAFDGTTGLGGSSFPIAQNVKQKVAYAFGARGQNLTVNGAAVINAAFDGTFGNGTNLRIENVSAGFIVSRFKIVRDEASDAELIAETA